jgi:glycosyl transferase family 25
MWPIVYINLDRDQHRRALMEAALAATPFAWERLPGVLWSQLGAAQQAQFYSAQRNRQQFFRPLVDGEKGCYASHLRACDWLLARDCPAVVVLEDDVALAPALTEVLFALYRELPASGWDMVKLYSRPVERAWTQRPLTGQHRLLTYRRVPSMSYGYVLHRDGAAKLLAARRPFGRPVDVDLRYWWESDLRILGVAPAVVAMGPEGMNSSIWRGEQRQPRTWSQRWRRWWFQLDYTARNAWHRRRQTWLPAV